MGNAKDAAIRIYQKSQPVDLEGFQVSGVRSVFSETFAIKFGASMFDVNFLVNHSSEKPRFSYR